MDWIVLFAVFDTCADHEDRDGLFLTYFKTAIPVWTDNYMSYGVSNEIHLNETQEIYCNGLSQVSAFQFREIINVLLQAPKTKNVVFATDEKDLDLSVYS